MHSIKQIKIHNFIIKLKEVLNNIHGRNTILKHPKYTNKPARKDRPKETGCLTTLKKKHSKNEKYNQIASNCNTRHNNIIHHSLYALFHAFLSLLKKPIRSETKREAYYRLHPFTLISLNIVHNWSYELLRPAHEPVPVL